MLCKAFAHNAKGTMSRRDARKAPDQEKPADAAKAPAAGEAFAIQEHIGRQLRGIFEDVVAQPVPEKFRQLLEELARKQRKS
jgi:Anti-sigma factor NepR